MKYFSEKRIAQAKASFNQQLGPVTSRSQFGGYSLSVNKVMFAVVSDGELYLRANDNIEGCFQARGMMNLVYSKRGMPVFLRYYHVDESLWNDNETLLHFAQLAYKEALIEVSLKKSNNIRLKDLPNLGVSLERLLWKAGIKNVSDLRSEGAKYSYLKLRKLHKNLGINVLFSLAGAINGYHQAVLPAVMRNELLEWFTEMVIPSSSKSKR